MPWKYTNDYYKNYTRETWDGCAESYVPLKEQLRPYHRALLERVRPRPDEIVLDVCTGPGEPAMTLSGAVGPSGRVVGVDLSGKMAAIARRSAAERRLGNVEFLTMDAEQLEFPDETFDLAVSCFGFQIVTDPEAAAGEILRVLKPGGRAGFTVWSPSDRAQALDVIIGPMLEHATPDEDGYLPTPYELGEAGEMASLLDTLGFVDAREACLNEVLSAPTVDRFLEMLLEGTPLGHSLSEEEPAVQKIVIEKTRRNIERFASPEGVKIPSECVIVTASKRACGS